MDLKGSIRDRGSKHIRTVEFHRSPSLAEQSVAFGAKRTAESILMDIMSGSGQSAASSNMATVSTNSTNEDSPRRHGAAEKVTFEKVTLPKMRVTVERAVSCDVGGGRHSSSDSVESIQSDGSFEGIERANDFAAISVNVRPLETAQSVAHFSPHPMALQKRSKSVPKLSSIHNVVGAQKKKKRKSIMNPTSLFNRRNSFGRDRAINRSGNAMHSLSEGRSVEQLEGGCHEQRT